MSLPPDLRIRPLDPEEASCAVHDEPDEGLGRLIVERMREPGGVDTCAPCIERACRDAYRFVTGKRKVGLIASRKTRILTIAPLDATTRAWFGDPLVRDVFVRALAETIGNSGTKLVFDDEKTNAPPGAVTIAIVSEAIRTYVRRAFPEVALEIEELGESAS